MTDIGTDSDFGSQVEDMDAINRYMRETKIINNAAFAHKDQFIRWWDNLSFYDKNWNDEAYDEARTRRNKFNLANVRDEQHRADVVHVITTGQTTEQMQGKPRPPVLSTGEVGSKINKPLTGEKVKTLPKGVSMPSTIRQGSSGPDVVKWQKIIGVTADGKFGPGTAAATKKAQAEKGLTPDGVVGPMTWTAFLGKEEEKKAVFAPPTPSPVSQKPTGPVTKPTLRLNSKGQAVIEWQTIVGIKPPTGVFGESTRKATIAFQKSHNLVADGVVGPNTWKAGMKSGTFAPPVPQVAFAPQPKSVGSKPAPAKPAPIPNKEKVVKVAQAGVGFFDFTKWPLWAQILAGGTAVAGLGISLIAGGKKVIR